MAILSSAVADRVRVSVLQTEEALEPVRRVESTGGLGACFAHIEPRLVLLGVRLVDQELELRRATTEVGFDDDDVAAVLIPRLDIAVVVVPLQAATVELEPDENGERPIPLETQLYHAVEAAAVVVGHELVSSALHELAHEPELLVHLVPEEQDCKSCNNEERHDEHNVEPVRHVSPRGGVVVTYHYVNKQLYYKIGLLSRF